MYFRWGHYAPVLNLQAWSAGTADIFKLTRRSVPVKHLVRVVQLYQWAFIVPFSPGAALTLLKASHRCVGVMLVSCQSHVRELGSYWLLLGLR